MKRYNTVIGIDPDADKSGVALLNVPERKLELSTLAFPALLDYLRTCKYECGSFVVVVEAGWLEAKSNFHPHHGRRAEKIAKDVGRNQETGRKIAEMCRYWGIDVVEHHPLRKMWKGPGRKITHAELAYFTGITGRTNQETRDAALIAWAYAGLPIRMNVR